MGDLSASDEFEADDDERGVDVETSAAGKAKAKALGRQQSHHYSDDGDDFEDDNDEGEATGKLRNDYSFEDDGDGASPKAEPSAASLKVSREKLQKVLEMEVDEF